MYITALHWGSYDTGGVAAPISEFIDDIDDFIKENNEQEKTTFHLCIFAKNEDIWAS